MNTKEELINKIQEKKDQLYRAQRECKAWNKGKYKNSSNAPVSRMLVDSIEKEMKKLQNKLDSL